MRSLAMQMLEQSLRRLQTDHLDLWQIHGVTFQNDPEHFIRPNGAAEALHKAKQQGKVRFVGFSGHKDPDIHLAMLNTGFPFDAVQMPLNPFDANFFSFEQKVLPVLNNRGIAPAGHEADWGPWRAGAEGRLHRGRTAALCHEPAGGHHHLRGFGIANPGTKSTHRAKLYPALSSRDEGFARAAQNHTQAMATLSFTRPRSSSTTPRRAWPTNFRSIWSRSK